METYIVPIRSLLREVLILIFHVPRPVPLFLKLGNLLYLDQPLLLEIVSNSVDEITD